MQVQNVEIISLFSGMPASITTSRKIIWGKLRAKYLYLGQKLGESNQAVDFSYAFPHSETLREKVSPLQRSQQGIRGDCIETPLKSTSIYQAPVNFNHKNEFY